MKKTISIILSIILTLSAILIPNTAFAKTDAAAAAKGFTVDLDSYESTSWDEIRRNNVYFRGVKVGTADTYVGYTRALDTVSYNGKDYHLDCILMKTDYYGTGAYKRWFGYVYGYADEITVNASFDSDQIMWAHDPTQTATSITYTIGGNASGQYGNNGGSIGCGISASQTFTKNALEINDLTIPSGNDVTIEYDYTTDYFWRWNWKISKYSYYCTTQKAAVWVLSEEDTYNVEFSNCANLYLQDDVPGYWTDYYYSTASNTVEWTGVANFSNHSGHSGNF